jgi:Xaa-Pro aminopeptidase
MARDLSKEEITERLRRFRAAMDRQQPGWDTAVIVSKINQYYLTGTMQDGLLLIRPDDAWFFVRRSYERAADESPFECIRPIQSYREAAQLAGSGCGKTYIESEIMTAAILERFEKYFKADSIGALGKTILSVRAVKTPYEVQAMTEAGQKHHEILTNIVPGLLREGMSELELSTAILEKMMAAGHHGVTRFQSFQAEMGIGQIGFGTNSLYPTNHDGPGGCRGLSAAVPLLGSSERKLKKGDTIFVDIGFGIRGYHSDKSQAYIFGVKPTAEMIDIQRGCLEAERRTAELLVPGAKPSDIYRTVMGALSNDFKRGFMGFEDRQVKFLGHGIGLHVDEPPVIAEGFDEPLEENMFFALEPKKGLRDVGLLGVEDTYLVTKDGARCITGGGRDIIEV